MQKKWFCHFDDDTYVNVPGLLSLLDKFNPDGSVYVGRAPSKQIFVSTRIYDEKTFTKKLAYVDEQVRIIQYVVCTAQCTRVELRLFSL